MLPDSVERRGTSDTAQLSTSLHSAQAQGLLRNPQAVRQLLEGIGQALERTMVGNASDPATAWALQSDAYWNHFEMDIKLALLTSCSGLDPALCEAVREMIDETLMSLKRRFRYS